MENAENAKKTVSNVPILIAYHVKEDIIPMRLMVHVFLVVLGASIVSEISVVNV